MYISTGESKNEKSAATVAADPIFSDPRLAGLYDPLDPDRTDLDLYCAIVDELGARSVIDLGCGTGTLACLLAGRGISVTGVDPAAASLAVARNKNGADVVRWICGDASHLPAQASDLVVMTGNVAQVFLDDEGFDAALRGARAAVHNGGHVVFEVRDPSREAWLSWNRKESYRKTEISTTGVVSSWVDLIKVELPFVSFRWTYHFENSGDVVTSDSTLRFRSREEVEHCLRRSGLVVDSIRDATNRPAQEFVFVCSCKPDRT